MWELLELWGTGFLWIEVLMMLFFVVYLLFRNVSVVDLGWSLSFLCFLGVLWFFGKGDFWRHLLCTLLVGAWAGRLTFHLGRRFSPGREDPRYDRLLSRWVFSGSLTVKVLCLYLIQGVIASFLCLPFLLIFSNAASQFSPWEVYGVLVWSVGFWGVTTADSQLARFRAEDTTGQGVCSIGLWKYSRHPNYFFEFVVWVAYAMIALGASWGFLGWMSPCLMLYLLVRVSGIPITEEIAREKHGQAYELYQQKTNAFWPWWPRF